LATISNARKSLFERGIPRFGSGVLGEWEWRNLVEDGGWWSKLADGYRGRVRYR
jgi:hypothetical protein